MRLYLLLIIYNKYNKPRSGIEEGSYPQKRELEVPENGWVWLFLVGHGNAAGGYGDTSAREYKSSERYVRWRLVINLESFLLHENEDPPNIGRGRKRGKK